MNLGKMVKIMNLNHEGSIVNIQKEMNDLVIDVNIRYLAKYIEKTYSVMKYKIINFREIGFNVNGKPKYEKTDEISNEKLTINTAEIGKKHSLLINVWSETMEYGKLYIWAGYENDIKIYDQKNNEIEYDRFIDICMRKPGI